MTEPYDGWFVCPSCAWMGDVAWHTDDAVFLDEEYGDVEYAVCPQCDTEMEVKVERRDEDMGCV